MSLRGSDTPALTSSVYLVASYVRMAMCYEVVYHVLRGGLSCAMKWSVMCYEVVYHVL